MRLIIDIPEEIYQEIKETNMVISGRRSGKRLAYILFNAINTGKPLPKGHGRLIDEEDIALIDEQFYVPSDYYVAESAINDAPTIIEGSDNK